MYTRWGDQTRIKQSSRQRKCNETDRQTDGPETCMHKILCLDQFLLKCISGQRPQSTEWIAWAKYFYIANYQMGALFVQHYFRISCSIKEIIQDTSHRKTMCRPCFLPLVIEVNHSLRMEQFRAKEYNSKQFRWPYE